ncbi:MAG: amidohydrolase family protein [Myxococcota bacterium]
MLIRRAELEGGRADLRLRAGRIHEIGADLERAPGEPSLDAGGGALLPGLHDHHIHLLSWAAARSSVSCDPRDTRDPTELEAALRGATPRSGWIRAVGYHDSVAGSLDRWRLDALRGDTPVRVQHRSGALWILNSAGLASLGLAEDCFPARAERDAEGRLTGRLFRLDGWLREQISPTVPPELAALSRELAALGVTGVTDASAGNGLREHALFSDAISCGAWRQRLHLLGGDDLGLESGARVDGGARKILLDERELPGFESLVGVVRQSHAAGRPVAIHCVTRTELALAAAALREARPLAGDRLEHASVAPPDLVERVAELGLTIVTQPNFLFERGDAYLEEVDGRDHPWLYRLSGWLDAGVALGGGTDAPFGAADPWRAMRAAVDRKTRAGRCMQAGESLSPERALALFTTDPARPGGPPRRLAIGAEADLCLLDRPWCSARQRLSGCQVRATWVGGELVWQQGD